MESPLSASNEKEPSKKETANPVDPYQSPIDTNPFVDPYPQYSGPFPEPRPRDKYAEISMILGIVALVVCLAGFFIGIIAIIFGHRSITHIQRDPKLGGSKIAIIGLVTGYLAIFLNVSILVYYILHHAIWFDLL